MHTKDLKNDTKKRDAPVLWGGLTKWPGHTPRYTCQLAPELCTVLLLAVLGMRVGGTHMCPRCESQLPEGALHGLAGHICAAPG